ncbi:energy transducer TonB [Roseomonas sp. KE0001]|uniref:energy transducer TonB n=1 Tax=Roseomonas sp. KE0001 TaxID=2479201 RepID=UPI0018DFB355|nr:energy transducer TonB [Roseomonas sp. KE0001]MBI0434025.1 energy transducer TonB [Roseomonas sp. KE0001]
MELTATRPPAGPRRRGLPRRGLPRLGPGLLVSLLLHAGLVAVLLFGLEREELPPPAPEQEVAVVFEPVPGEPPPGETVAEQPSAPAEPPPAVPTPLAPPDPQAVEVLPPEPPAPAAEAEPAPPPPPSPPVAEVPPEPAPPEPPAQEAPPEPAPPVAQARPAPPLDLPPELRPEALLARPTPFTLRPPPPPSPQAPPQRPPQAPASPFQGTVMLGRPPALAPRRAQPPGRPGAIDTAIGPVPQRPLGPAGPLATNNATVSHVAGTRASRNWQQELLAWVRSRGFYPPQAAMAGESGPVTLQVTVARDGRVTGLRMISRSGSRWLDMGATAIFRDGQAPRFTPEMEGDSTTFNFTIHYVLTYR